ncbi:TPA: hypothetical protein QIC06_004534 [Enterobacter kobei]|nr:hypothetical protein [Enterobacter kobei]
MFKLSDYFHIKQELAGEPAAPGGEPSAPPSEPAQPASLLGGQPKAEEAPPAAVAEPFLKELPAADDKEGWAAVYAKMGRPESADGYELPVPEGDAGEFAKTTSQWMHEAGLSKQQAQALATHWNEHHAAQAEAQQAALAQQVEKDMTAMKQAWGADFDANSAIVRTAVNTFAPPEFIEMLDKSGLINSPVIANMFLKIGAAIGEDKSVTANKSSPLGGESDLAQRMWPGMN